METFRFVVGAILVASCWVGLSALASIAFHGEVSWLAVGIGVCVWLVMIVYHVTEYGPRGFAWLVWRRGPKPPKRFDAEVFRD